MLALAGQPSLHGYYACMVFWAKGCILEKLQAKYTQDLFFSFLGFSVWSKLFFLVGWYAFWHSWIGRARHPGPGAVSFAVEVFNVGGWLTHGDLVLDTEVDFLAVVEHRLIPARVRGEWARLRRKGWLLSGLLLLRTLLMLVLLGLGLSVSGVLLFPCLPLLLRSLSVFLIVVVRLGVCCRWSVAGFCTWWCCMDIRVLIGRLRNLL